MTNTPLMKGFPFLIFFLFLLVFSVCPNANAQTAYDVSGYLLNIPIIQSTNSNLASLSGIKQNHFIDLTRLRLRPSVELKGGGYFSLEYEVSFLYVSSSLPIQLSSSRSQRQLLDLNWSLVTEENVSAVHFIDRLYYRKMFDLGEVTIGRQRISWGTGRIWNPTDFFNPLNPATFSKIEKDGIDAVSGKFFLGSFSDLSLIYNPEDRFRKKNFGGRLRSNISEYDLAVLGGYFDDQWILGTSFAGNLATAGIRGEMIIRFGIPPASNSVKYVIGLDHQITSRLYGLIEHHFNGEGKKNKSGYELDRLLRGEIINVGKQYTALQGSYLIHPLLSGTIILMMSHTDDSGFIGSILSYSTTQEFSVSLGGQLFFGKDFTEFWYYPNSLYLRADLFF